KGAPYNPALANQPSFFDGIDISLSGIAALAPDAKKAVPLVLKTNLAGIAQKIESAQQSVSAGHLDYAANDLATAIELVDMLIKNLDELKPEVLPADQKQNLLHELRIKRTQLNDALALALNVQLDATVTTTNGDVVAGSAQSVSVTISADPKFALSAVGPKIRNDRAQTINASIPLVESGQRKHTIVDWFSRPLPTSGTRTTTIAVHEEGLEHITRPYFTRRDAEQAFYDLTDPQLRN